MIVWGKTRDEAIARMKRSLFSYKITGVKTSIKFLERIMTIPDFINGNYNTHFIEKNKKALEEGDRCKGECKAMAIIAAFVDYNNKLESVKPKTNSSGNSNGWKLYNRRKNMVRF